MSINFNCPNRIKPKLLREQKTEALLVFIRTTLEESLNQLNQKNISAINFGSEEETQYIYDILNKLLNQLKECVVNSSYLQSLIQNSGKNRAINLILQKEKPLMIYYDAIVKSIAKNLPNGSSWIPEIMVISLLSQWILEEEKSTYLYPFLNEINYIDLFDRFDKVKLNTDDTKKDVIMDMYTLSTKLIDSLKRSTCKTSSKKKINRNK